MKNSDHIVDNDSLDSCFFQRCLDIWNDIIRKNLAEDGILTKIFNSDIQSKYSISLSDLTYRLEEHKKQIKIIRLKSKILRNLIKNERIKVYERSVLSNINYNKCNVTPSVQDPKIYEKNQIDLQNTKKKLDKFKFIEKNTNCYEASEALISKLNKEHLEQLKLITRMLITSCYFKEDWVNTDDTEENQINDRKNCTRKEISNAVDIIDLICLNEDEYITLTRNGSISLLRNFEHLTESAFINRPQFIDKNVKKIFYIENSKKIILITDEEAFFIASEPLKNLNSAYEGEKIFTSKINLKFATGEEVKNYSTVILLMDVSAHVNVFSYSSGEKLKKLYDFDALNDGNIPIDAFISPKITHNYLIVYSKKVLIYDLNENIITEIISINNLFPDTTINCAFLCKRKKILMLGLQNGVILGFSLKKVQFVLQITFKEPISSIYMDIDASEILVLTSTDLFLCLDKKYCLFHEKNLPRRFDSLKNTSCENGYTLLDKKENKITFFEKPCNKRFSFAIPK